MSRVLISLALILVAVLSGFIAFRPDNALRVATGVVAHDLCSKAFVSGLDPKAVLSETLTRPGIRWLRPAISYRLDNVAKTITASVVGAAVSKASYRKDFGCVIQRDRAEPYMPKIDIATLKAYGPAPLLKETTGPSVVEPINSQLKEALEHAFDEADAPDRRRTKAIIVARDGTVIAERYAADLRVGADTPLLGFSMTKSVVNALIGILIRQQRLSLSQPAPIAEWSGSSDPRQAITIEQLLRMTSGLALDETNSGFDRASQMVYLSSNMGASAADASLVADPGTRWAYSSPTTQLLARIISETVGGPEETLKFAWRELFNPLGMQSVLQELDATGAIQGSSYMFASARDWARFGYLYLSDGVVAGQRILPPGWVDFSASATLNSDYGAGFWTNRSQHEHAKSRISAGIPRDAFFASGNLGQRIVVLPTQRLVIVRLGDAVDPTGDMRGLTRLVREVVLATK